MKSLVCMALAIFVATPAQGAYMVMNEVLEGLAGEGTRGRAIETDLDAAADVLRSALGTPAHDDLVEQAFTGPDGASLVNLLVVDPGSDPDAGWIVVGAHYDHLGLGEKGSAHRGRVHPGADDNASGCAVLAELVHRWRSDFADANERGVVFAFLTAEEVGLAGARHFVENPPDGVDEIVAMVNLDTVGRLADGGLTVFGAESGDGLADALQGINTAFGLEMDLVDRSSGASDDMAFVEAGVPAIHLFTGAHPTYHRPTDTLETLDREGLGTLLDFTTELVDYLSYADVTIEFVPPGADAALADPERATEGRRRVTFGSIPDFQATDVEGVKISGVIPGSPAEDAGLQAGDVIVGFGGGPVEDLTDYSEAMKRYGPGDEVEVEFVRDGERGTVSVTLVERR